MKPVLQALVLADRVYQDVSGKKVICGTFNAIKFSRKSAVKKVAQPDGTQKALIPGGMHGGSPYAYVSLTDVCENTLLQVQFVNLTKNAVLFSKEVTVNCPDRLATVELVLPLPPLPVHEPGIYAFEVVCEGDILGSCRIKAEELSGAS